MAPRPPRGNPRPSTGSGLRLQNVTGAGSVIFRRRAGVFEIFFVKNAYGYWTFPKGKQQKGETLVETAIREAREEAGLSGLKLVAPLGRTQFRFRQAGSIVQKTVHFYLFEVPSDAKEHMTGVEGGMWEAIWVNAQEAFATSGYRNLDRLLSKALRIISYEQRKQTGFSAPMGSETARDTREFSEPGPFQSRKPRVT